MVDVCALVRTFKPREEELRALSDSSQSSLSSLASSAAPAPPPATSPAALLWSPSVVRANRVPASVPASPFSPLLPVRDAEDAAVGSGWRVPASPRRSAALPPPHLP